MIEIRGLTKSFNRQIVLDDLTFDIPTGKITVLMGPSGTGKTVFIKHLIGILKPDRGKVWIDGVDVTALSGRALYEFRRRFGILFQDGALFGSLSVYDNIAFPLRHNTDKGEEEIRRIVAEKLKAIGLPGIEKKMPWELSGGMRKRVGLARALALDPEIVLFDEPTSGLDPVKSALINELLVELQEQMKCTFIVISHDVASSFRIAHQVGVLYKGRLLAYGPKDEVRESKDPAIRQFLTGSARGPMHEI